MKIIRIAAASLVLATFFSACSSSPTPEAAEKALREQVESESDGHAKLMSFMKTDGQAFETSGVKGYKMAYLAEITFDTAGLWLAHDLLKHSHDGLTFSVRPGPAPRGALDQLSLAESGATQISSGGRVMVAGELDGQKTENGWQFRSMQSHVVVQSGSGATSESGLLPSPATRDACIVNLKEIESAKQYWAIDKRKVPDDRATVADIEPYIRGKKMLQCPGGGSYTLNSVRKTVQCSIPDHELKD